MKTRKLIEIITTDAKKLYSLIKEINVVWPSTHLQIIEVMLQNMACYSPEAANWNDEARLVEIEKIVKALRALEQYHSYHVTQFVADEAQNILLTAHFVVDVEFEEESDDAQPHAFKYESE